MAQLSGPREGDDSPEVTIPKLGSLIVLGKNIEIPARKLHVPTEEGGKKSRIIYSDATEMNARAAGVFLTYHIKQHGYCPLVIFSTGPTSGEGHDSEAEALEYILLRDFPRLKEYRTDKFYLEKTSRNTPQNAAEVFSQYGSWLANLKPTGLITTSYHIDRAAEDFIQAGIHVTKLTAEQTVALDPNRAKYVSDFSMNLQGIVEGTFDAIGNIPGVSGLVKWYSNRSRQ